MMREAIAGILGRTKLGFVGVGSLMQIDVAFPRVDAKAREKLKERG